MYFNHKESTQEQLNDLITKAFNMSEEVVTCKVDRREGDFMIGGMRMGKGGRKGPMGMMNMFEGMLGGRGMFG